MIGSIVREMVVDSQSKIMFEELPNVDRILQLLSDILLVRSFNLLELEVELYEKLVYIHRDPYYLIHITRKTTNNNNNKKRYKEAITKLRI